MGEETRNLCVSKMTKSSLNSRSDVTRVYRPQKKKDLLAVSFRVGVGKLLPDRPAHLGELRLELVAAPRLDVCELPEVLLSQD